MRIRREVEVTFMPVMGNGRFDVPDDARIVAVDFYDAEGLHQGRRPSGVWIETTVRRYDDDHPERWPEALLPPPERGT